MPSHPSPPVTVQPVEPVSCRDCPLGRVSGADEGLFCPFVTRTEPTGAVLMRAGEPAERVWFVKSGVVGASQAADGAPADAVDRVHLPGSFVGLECLTHGRYHESARVLARAELCTAPAEAFLEWMIQTGARLAFVDRAWRAARAAAAGHDEPPSR